MSADIDEQFDKMREGLKDDGEVDAEVEDDTDADGIVDGIAAPDPDAPTPAPKSRAQELREKVAAKKPAVPRNPASYDFHVLGDTLPDDPAPQPSARDRILANMEACKSQPGMWCVLGTYASRKSADSMADRIVTGKQPKPDGVFDVEVRSPQVGATVKHIVAGKFIGDTA